MRPKPPCGTYGGYRQHTLKNEPQCDACRQANRDYRLALEARSLQPGYVPSPPAACGTVAAYQRHHLRGEPPCPACVEAHRVYQRTYRAKNRARFQAYEKARENTTALKIAAAATRALAALAETGDALTPEQLEVFVSAVKARQALTRLPEKPKPAPLVENGSGSATVG